MMVPDVIQPLQHIETTLSTLLQEIVRRPVGHPQITLKRIVRDRSNRGRNITEREITYRWPGKNREEAWRFACVGKILAEIYEAIRTSVMITKRDIYYRDPELYGKQAIVDRYVDDIACTCNVTRRELNVTASPKGLHAGLLLPYPYNISIQAFNTVPDSVSHLQECRFDQINWILVIEKDATFRSLVERSFHKNSVHGRGILITAKGYPDLSTRRFLRTTYDHSTRSRGARPQPGHPPSLPLLGLFDADPDGINILQIYRQGSLSLPHERSLNTPEMQWLGVRMRDVLAAVEDDEAVLRMTGRDRQKAVRMLEGFMGADQTDEQCKAELQTMLVLNVKAEMQILDDRRGGLPAWLDGKIGTHLA